MYQWAEVRIHKYLNHQIIRSAEPAGTVASPPDHDLVVWHVSRELMGSWHHHLSGVAADMVDSSFPETSRLALP